MTIQKTKYYFLGLAICFCHFFSPAQQSKTDSLYKIYNNKTIADTNRLKAVHEIVKSYIESKPDTSIFFAEQELKLAQTTKQKKFEAKALNAIGLAFANKNDSAKAMEFYLKALDIRVTINDREGIRQTCRNLSNFYNPSGALKFWFSQLKKCERINEKQVKDRREIAECLFQIGEAYNTLGEKIKGLENYQKALSVYQEIKDTVNIVNTALELCSSYSLIGNLPKALECCQKGLAMARQFNYERGVASFLERMGDIYSEQGNNDAALECYQKNLTIVNGLNDVNLISFALRKTGNIYSQMHNDVKALECYNKVILLAGANKDEMAIRWMYQNVAEMYQNNKDYAHALEYYQKILSLSEKLNEKGWVANMYGCLGNVYRLQGDLERALEYQHKYLQLTKELNANDVWANFGLAAIYKQQKNYRKAKFYSDLAYSELKKGFDARGISDAEELAAQIDSALGNYKEAYYHYQQYIIIRDKLNSEEVRKAAVKEKYQNEYDKQKETDKKEQERKDALSSAEKRKQQLFLWSVTGGLFMAIFLAAFIFRSLRVTRKQKQLIELKSKETEEQKKLVEIKNKEVEEKNKDILDSIRYARRIQTSLLPTEKYIDRILKKRSKNNGHSGT
ncbi:MAG: tetratricopeptide repeat protein [Bacteroidia bacterium]|nr:tetratricopeptide repeat protein [Bacteroidia bacterium]